MNFRLQLYSLSLGELHGCSPVGSLLTAALLMLSARAPPLSRTWPPWDTAAEVPCGRCGTLLSQDSLPGVSPHACCRPACELFPHSCYCQQHRKKATVCSLSCISAVSLVVGIYLGECSATADDAKLLSRSLTPALLWTIWEGAPPLPLAGTVSLLSLGQWSRAPCMSLTWHFSKSLVLLNISLCVTRDSDSWIFQHYISYTPEISLSFPHYVRFNLLLYLEYFSSILMSETAWNGHSMSIWIPIRAMLTWQNEEDGRYASSFLFSGKVKVKLGCVSGMEEINY